MIGCDLRRAATAALVAVGLVAMRALPAAAQASDAGDARAQAQAHLSRGNDLFTSDKFEEALAEFQAAFAAFPSPKLHFNIGQCQRALGHRAEALAEFRRFVEEAGDVSPELRGEAERYIAELKPIEAPAPPPRPAPAPGLAATAAIASGPLVTPPAPPAHPMPDMAQPLYKRWWFWAAVGVVVAGATTGTVLWLRSRDPDCSVNCFK